MTAHRIHVRAYLSSLIAALAVAFPAGAIAIEEPAYEVVRTEGELELRRYAPYHIVSTPAGTDFDGTGDAGFRTLFRYITGTNADAVDMDMTAPVLQTWDEAHWSLAFVVPAEMREDAIPAPTTPGVAIETVAGGLYAATRFTGRWSEARFLAQEARLREAVAAVGLHVCGPTRYARYDPPFKPPFLRRNEVLLPVSEAPCTADAKSSEALGRMGEPPAKM